MMKIADVEANLEQYRNDQAAINSEAAAQRALLQETIEKNKIEADRYFAEFMNAIKTQQPSTTTPPVTLPLPTHPMVFAPNGIDWLWSVLNKGTQQP
nr:hypothetical protein [Tanacetum cinerariifolium]